MSKAWKLHENERNQIRPILHTAAVATGLPQTAIERHLHGKEMLQGQVLHEFVQAVGGQESYKKLEHDFRVAFHI